MKVVNIFVALVVLFVGSDLHAQEPSVSSKTLKYHKVLVKRPNSGYLYDRFYGSWLEGGTVESLQAFLLAESRADTATTGDHLLLAFFYAKQGEDAKALEVFAKALQQDGSNAEAWLEKAKAEARTLDFETALADLTKALEAGPKAELEVRIKKLKGRLLAKDGKNEQALKVWQALMAENADDAELREDVIELLSDEGLYDEAIVVAKALSETTRDPYQKIQRKLLTGDLQQRAGSREEALATYGESLAQTGHGTWIEREILSQIDRMFRREDDIDGLQAFFSDLLKKEGKRIALRQRRAGLLGELGDEKAAIEAWREILELTPGDLPVREAFIEALAQMKRHEEAVKQMQALLKISLDDPERLLSLARLQWAAEDAESAGKSVARYLEQSERDEYAYLRAARLLQTFRLEQETLAVYKKMLVAFPESLAAREAYAGFLFESKHKEEALGIWEKLAAEGDAVQVIRTARTLIARGQFPSAYQVLKARYDELKGDDLYLAQLIDAALRAKVAGEAFPWVRRRVLLASSASELVDATGQALQLLRRSEDAEQLLQEMQKNEQALSPQELCLLAELHNHLGDFKAADELLLKVQGEGREFALAQQARLHFLRKDWASAAEIVQQQIELPGGRKTSNVQQLVDLYQRSGDLDKTLQWIGEWKKLSPGSASPWMREAKTLLESGKVDESLKILRLASRRFEDNKAVRVKLAETFVETGKTRDAVQIYWRLYDESEDALQKMVWVGKLGRIASENGGAALLIERFQERKRQNRKSIVPLLALAEIYRVGDRYEERRQAILEAARLQPKDVALLHQLASIDEQEGKIGNARQSLRTAMEFDKSGRTHKRLARLYFLTADYEKGFEIMQQAKGGGKDVKADPELLEEVFYSIIQGGEWERAADFLKRFLAERPQDYRLQYLYAVALEESEQYEMAMDAFESLLSYKVELPARKNASNNANPYANVYYQQTAAQKKIQNEDNKLLGYPEEALKMMEVKNYNDFAYHYRRGRGEGRIYGFSSNRNNGWQWGGYANGQHVMPPMKLEQVRFYALAHLTKINQQDEGEGNKKIETVLKDYGISPLLVEWQRRIAVAEKAGESERGKIFSEWLKEDPENEVLHALAMQNWENVVLDIDQREATVDYYLEKNPALAFFAGLKFVQNNWKNEEEKKRARAVFDKGLAVAGKIDPVPMQVFQWTVMNAAKQASYRQVGESLLTDEQRARLRELAVRWQPEITARTADIWGGWASVSMLGLMAEDDDISPLLSALEKEMRDYQKEKKQAVSGAIKQQSKMMLASLQQNMAFEALSIPPGGMYDISQTAISFFPGATRASTAYARSVDWADKEKLEQIKAWAPGVKDPILRALAAQFVGDKDLVKKTVEELIKSDPPTASALMVAAALLLEGEQNKKTIDLVANLLGKASQLSTLPLRSRVIDGALINLGLSAEKDSLAQKNGRAAIKRVLAAMKIKQSYQMRQMAETMRSLGLEKEASQMTLLVTQKQNAGGATTTLGQAMSPSALSAKIGQMMKRGKRDAAIRTAAKQLKPIVAGILGQGASYNDYEFKELRKVIDASSLKDEILKEAAPSKGAGLVERVQYGALCEMLGVEEEAVKVYQTVLQERPNDDNLRIRLIQLLASKDREATVRHLAKIKNPNSLQVVLQSIRNSLYNVESDEERFDLVESALLILENIKESKDDQGQWWEHIRGFLARKSYNNGSPGLTALTARWDLQTLKKRKDFNEEKFKAALKRRRQLHDKICQEMLQSETPGLAPLGFAWLNVTRAEEGVDRKEISEQARQVLGRMKEVTLIANDYSIGPAGSGGSGDKDTRTDLQVRGPIEWLVNEAWQKGDRDMIYKDILPEIEKDKEREELAKGLRAYADLYFCDPKKFGDSIEGMKKVMTRWGGLPVALKPISTAYRTRDLKFDLAPVIDQLIADIQGNAYVLANVLPNLLSLGAKEERSQRTEKVLRKLAEKWLGPVEDRKAILEKHHQASRGGTGQHNQKVQMMEHFLSQCGNYPEMVFVAINFVGEQGMGSSNSMYELFNVFQKNDYFSKDANKGVALLKASPLMDSLEDMRVLPVKGYARLSNSDSATLLGSLWSQLRNLNEKEREPYQQWIESLPEPKPIGAQLILASWEKKHSLAAAEVFAKHEKQIRALPQERQLEMALLATDVIKAADITGGVDGKVKATWDWLQVKASEAAGDETVEFLAAKKIADLGIEYYNLDDYSAKLIKKTVANDTAKAVQIFAKTLSLVEGARGTGSWRQTFYRGETFSQRLMMNIARSLSAEKALEFESKILRMKDLPEVTPIVWNTSNSIARALSEEWKPSDSDPGMNRFGKIFARLGSALNEEPPMVLAGPVFFHMLFNRSEKVMEEVLNWASLPTTTAQYPKLAKEVEMAARLQLAMKQAGKAGAEKKDNLMPQEVTDYYLPMMQDETLPRSVRLFMLSYLLEKSRVPLPDDAMVTTSIELLTESLKGDTPVLDKVLQKAIPFWLQRREIPRWNEMSKNLSAAYQIRYFSGRAPQRLRSRPDDDAVLLMARLQFAAGNKGQAHQILSKAESSFSDFTQPLLMLIGEGEYTAAARMLRKQTDKLGESYGKLVWDETLSTHAGDFLKSIESPSIRLLARTLLAKTPDPENSDARNQRMKVVAEEFVALKLENQLLKEQVLYWLSQNPASYQVVKKIISEEVAKVKVEILFESRNDRGQRQKIALIKAEQAGLLRQGKTQAYADLLEQLASLSTRNTYYRDRFIKDLAHLPNSIASQQKYAADTVKKMLPAWSVVFSKVKFSSNVSSGKHHMGHMVFAYTQSDQLDLLFEWSDALTDKAQKKKVTEYLAGCGVTLTSDASKFLKKEPERIEFLEKLASAPGWMNGNYGVSYSFFRMVAQKRLIPRAKIIEIGPALAEKTPRLGYAWMELAEIQQQNGKSEAALPYWDRSIEAAKQGEKTHPGKAGIAGTSFLVKKIKTLLKLKRIDEAKAVFAKIDPKKIINYNRKDYEKMKKDLGSE